MRHAFLVALLCFIAVPAALAQDAAPKSASRMPPPPGRVQLVENDGKGVLRVLFDGSEVARCHATQEKYIECEVTDVNAAILPAVNEPGLLPASSGGP